MVRILWTSGARLGLDDRGGIRLTRASEVWFRGNAGGAIVGRWHSPSNRPLEPMLAKAADGLPTDDGWLFEPKWDGFRALVFRDGDEIYIQSRDLKPLDRYFPELAAPLRGGAARSAASLDGEIVIADATARSTSRRCCCASTRPRRASKMLAEESPACVRRLGPARARRRGPARRVPQGERRARLEAVLGGAEPPIHLTPATRDRATRRRLVRALRGRRPRRRRRQAARRAVPAGQAGDAQDQAPAHRRLRRRRLPLAQERAGHARRLAAARPVRRRRARSTTSASPSSFTWDRRAELVDGAGAAARGRARRPSVARVGRVGRPATPTRPASGCPARRAAGTAARTCRGSRCAPSASPRSPTTTSRATASGTRRRSSAGARTSRPRTAATTSSRRACPSCSPSIFGTEG